MFAGHVGAALALGRFDRRVNVGLLVASALLLDLVLWVLVLLGWESVTIPSNFANTHQPEFVFPYSHGLVASLGWSACAGAVGLVWYSRLQVDKWRVAALIATAVFSHWLLDMLVHSPELPLLSDNSLKVGLNLWQVIPVALAVEAAIVVSGLLLFISNSHLSRIKLAGIVSLSVLVLFFTVVGMTIAPPPPSARVMAASSLIILIVLVSLACWLGRVRGEKRT